jgi:4,5-DOPA dioxygenase extradiol
MGRMPTIFFGHGNPMNALAQNEYTRAWHTIGTSIPKPKAILMVSAHWYLPGTRVTTNEQPRTIHDFGGFPRELYEVQYPAPGSPELAAHVTQMLAPQRVQNDSSWGLDHGTWSVLVHAFPDASVPVVQLSIDETQPPRVHYEIGKQLRALRDEGVLIAGSGNLIHNLEAYAWGRHAQEPYDWALRFERKVRELVSAHLFDSMVDYESMGNDAILSAPTPDHYLPLLYVLGASDESDAVSFPIDGIDGGSISMLSMQFTPL